MQMRFVFALFVFFCAFPARAAFFDRPDYFENKAVYDEVETIIETLYDTTISEHERELRLVFRDKKLVPTFRALKNENEKILRESLLQQGLSDAAVEVLLVESPVIDGLKVTLENDFIAGTDQYYSNGLRVEISFNNPEFEKFFKRLGFDHSDFFFLCGQNMYTNSDKDSPVRKPDEPPHAGVLYCGGAVNSYKMDKEKARLRSLQRIEAQLGTIGRGSYAEEVQNGIHRLIGSKIANWDFQVADRFYFNINFQKYKKLAEGDLYGDAKPEYNVIINGGGNAGSFTNFVNAGVVFNYRLLGTLIDMYVGNKMTPTLAEELAMLSVEQRLKRLLCQSDWSINLYFGAEGRFVINNYRIDGSSDYNTASVPFVVDLKAGVVARYKRVYLDVGIVRRSSEWNNSNGQADGPAHVFGMFSITVRFDNFRNLGEQLVHPVRWIADAAYRSQMAESRTIRDTVLKDGLKLVFDSKDPKSPSKQLSLRCR